MLVLQSYRWCCYWLLWYDVCWSCSLTVGAGIGCYGLMSAGLVVSQLACIGCYGMISAGLAVLQMALVLAVMA